ncbi:hypothetical protein PVMG_02760, partial [Plasmodium vivax Mauritania I]
MRRIKKYNKREKINIFLFFIKTTFFFVILLTLNCSSHRKYGKTRGEKNDFGDAFDLRTRSLALKYANSNNSPVFKTRIVEEITPAGFKKYDENYESKLFKFMESVDNGKRDCDEKYEGSRYGFRESSPYEVPWKGGYQGPNLIKLRNNFPMRLNFSDDGDDDEGSTSLMDSLPGSLRACERMIYAPMKKIRKKPKEEVKEEPSKYPLRNSMSNGLRLYQKGEEGGGYKLKNQIPGGLREGRRSEESRGAELKNKPKGGLEGGEKGEDSPENAIKSKPKGGLTDRERGEDPQEIALKSKPKG